MAPFDRPCTTFYWFAIVNLYRFWVIWRWIISWPWNLDSRSLKVIQTGTIRKIGCGFLFAFRSNHGSILHHLQGTARYWSQNRDSFHTRLHSTPPLGRSMSEFFNSVWYKKLEWWGYPTVEKLWGYVWPFRHNTGVWRTDRQTDGQTDRYLATA